LQLRGTVRGIRVRESTGVPFAKRKQAEEARARREAELLEQAIHGRPATVTFAEACAGYLKNGGRKGTGGFAAFHEAGAEALWQNAAGSDWP
jgi:hypothetical protein